jgi:hypothetical protein
MTIDSDTNVGSGLSLIHPCKISLYGGYPFFINCLQALYIQNVGLTFFPIASHHCAMEKPLAYYRKHSLNNCMLKDNLYVGGEGKGELCGESIRERENFHLF